MLIHYLIVCMTQYYIFIQCSCIMERKPVIGGLICTNRKSWWLAMNTIFMKLKSVIIPKFTLINFQQYLKKTLNMKLTDEKVSVLLDIFTWYISNWCTCVSPSMCLFFSMCHVLSRCRWSWLSTSCYRL